MSNLKTGNLQSSTAIQVFQFFTVRIEVGSQKVPPSFHFHQNAIIFAKLKGVMLRLLALYDNKHDISENDRCYYGNAAITLLQLFIPEIHIFSVDEGGDERHTTGGRSRMPTQNIEQQGICCISAYFCKNTIFGCELPALACGFIFQKLWLFWRQPWAAETMSFRWSRMHISHCVLTSLLSSLNIWFLPL